ncbi:MAG: multiheme c-type cytochrome [Gemmatimonadota bacterium]
MRQDRSRAPRAAGRQPEIALIALLAALPAIAGCRDEKIVKVPVEVPVEVERPLFEPPPPGAASFLGFSDEATDFTVCGACHIGQQSSWQGTAHANAWDDLQNSGHAQALCENCHAVSEFGNEAAADVAWTATLDPRYHDVQCESCHGPGEGHVMDPDASQPLASADVSSTATNGCGECHKDTHHPFVEQWEMSAHSGVVGFAADRPECESCHRGQATLRAWGETAEYVEKNDPTHLAITCVVCHDPHDATNAHQLRFPVNTTSIDEHLCARCHDRRTVPDPTSSHGLAPHAPESELLMGEAGWFPPGLAINRGDIVATHGSSANPELCATCHVSTFTVTDAATGGFVLNATGHTFEPIPCLDAQGVPTTGPCPLDTTSRSFNGCVASGCHGSEQAAFSALTLASARIEARATDLMNQLLVVDPGLNAAGGEIDASDSTFTVAEGAYFNYNMAFQGSSGEVFGSTTHNPFLMEALLVASIQEVESFYGVPVPSVRRDWAVELQTILDRAPR